MDYEIKDLNQKQLIKLIGVNDNNLHTLEDIYGCGIVYRDNILRLLSDDLSIFNKFKEHLDYITNNIDSIDIDSNYIYQSYNIINKQADFNFETIAYSNSDKPYKCKTYNQYLMYKAIKNHDLTIVYGPAGTGKTFEAVLMACNALKNGEVNKIIITRPAVEAGESLGFLPGDLKEKIDPYLMPIYDSLDLLLTPELKDKYLMKGIIEIIPLAYMRGRTLDDAYVILDEAQNTTIKQMLMFLTRLGTNSKMIVNGDITQIDLNITSDKSGLVKAVKLLKNIDDIAIIEFKEEDIVRNPLVAKIIKRFKEGNNE